MSDVEGAAVERKSRVWMGVLALICLSLFAYAAYQRNFASNFLAAAGFYLVLAVVVALLFCAVVSGARQLRWTVFGIILASSIVGHVLGVQLQKQETRQMNANLKEAFQDFVEQTDWDRRDEVPRPIALQPVSSNLEGDMGVAEILTKTMLNDFAQLQNDYLHALEKAGWMTVLDPGRLSKDRGMKESQAIVAASEAVVLEYQAKAIAIVDSLPERAKQAPFRSEVARSDVLKNLEKGQARARENHKVTWDYELQIMREYAAVIDLLVKRQGHYTLEDSQVLFDDPADADTYNALMSRADELTVAQAEFAKRIQNDALEELRKLSTR